MLWLVEIQNLLLNPPDEQLSIGKVNSGHEACANAFEVHMLKFEILQIRWRSKAKNIEMLDSLIKNWKLRVWCSLFHFLLICMVSNFDMWTKKHLAHASCTEFHWRIQILYYLYVLLLLLAGATDRESDVVIRHTNNTVFFGNSLGFL